MAKAASTQAEAQPVRVQDRDAVLQVVCRSIGAQAVALFSSDDTSKPLARYSREGVLDDAWLKAATDRLAKHPANATPGIYPLEDDRPDPGRRPPRYIVVLGLKERAPTLSSVVCLASGDAQQLRQLCDRLALATGLIAEFELRQGQLSLRNQVNRLRIASKLLDQVNHAKKFHEAAMSFCNELASQFDLERASLGVKRGPYMRLVAASAIEQINRKMEYVQLIEATMEESADQQEPVIYPSPKDVDTVSRAASKLAHHVDAGAVCSLPMVKDEVVELVLTTESSPERMPNLASLEAMQLAMSHVGPTLLRRYHQDRWIGAKAVAGTRSLAAAVIGPRHTWIKLIVLVMMAIAAFLVFAKGTYRVEASFVIEPTSVHLIDTPFDGTIESANAEPGDIVAKGDVLARLRTTELQLELLSLAADRERYAREADLALRENRQADRHIALARRDQAEAQIKRIQSDIDRAVITSPIDGLIMQGDLREYIGGTTQRGQVLLKLMPADSLRGSVLVNESQINDIHVGATGWVSPASDPSLRLPVTVERIAPMARLEGAENVFPVRVHFDERPDWLAPGMEGVARIDVEQRRYAWIWTRSAVNWLRMKLWW